MASNTIRISILANAKEAVKGLGQTTAAAKVTSNGIADLDRRVSKLNGRTAKVALSVKGFAQTVAALTLARIAADRLNAGFPDLSFGLTDLASRLALVTAGALSATGAIGPLAGTTAGLAAALGAAAAGVALFGAVALPTIKSVTTAVSEYNTASHAFDRAKAIGDTEKMAIAQRNMASALGVLNPAQRAAANQVLVMSEAWDKLSRSQAPLVLTILARGSRTLAQIIPRLTPAINAMAKVINAISGRAFTGLSSATQPFVKLVVTQGVPALKSLATIVAHLLPTIGHVVTAFAPLGNKILAALIPVTRAIRGFNFAPLAQSASRLLPTVVGLLRNVAGVIASVVKASAPLAGPVLQVLSGVAKAISAAFAGTAMQSFVASLKRLLPSVVPIVVVVVTAFTKFASIIAGQLVPLMPRLLPLVTRIANVFVDVLTGLSPLLPALLDFADVFVSLLPIVHPVIIEIQKALVPVIGILGVALQKLAPSLPPLVAALVNLAIAATPLIPVLAEIVAMLAGGLTKAITALTPSIGQTGAQLREIGPNLERLSPVFQDLINALPSFAEVLGVAGSAIGFLADHTEELRKVLPLIIGAFIAFKVAQVASNLATLLAIPLRISELLVTRAHTAALRQQIAATNVMTASTAVSTTATGANTVATNVGTLSLVRAKAAMIAHAIATRTVAAATAIWTGIQAAFNVVMALNPITLVVIAIIALVAVIILAYKNSDTFRRIVDGALRAVGDAFKWLWEGAKAVFGWLADNWKLILVIISGPVGIAVALVVKYWTRIRTFTLTVFNGIRSHFVGLWNAVVAVFRTGINNVVRVFNGIMNVINKIVEFRNAVIGYFVGLARDFINAGKNIMQGLINGIAAGFNWVRDKLKGLAGLIPDWLKSALGIRSPSTVMATVGSQIIQGLALGIKNQVPALKRQLGALGGIIESSVSPSVNVDLVGSAQLTGASRAGTTYNVNVSVAPTADRASIGREILAAIAAEERRSGRTRLVPAL